MQQKKRAVILKWVVRFILETNDEEIMEIIKAVTLRYKNKFPEWDVSFLSLHRDPVQRELELDNLVAFIRNHPEFYEPHLPSSE